MSNIDILNELRTNPYVREKQLEDGISSFNFTNKCFYKSAWDQLNCRARGLFIRQDKIIARSYDKFFHIDEAKKYGLGKEEFSFPCEVYIKENGYLGICSSYDGKNLFCASKSTNQGWFAEEFKRILLNRLGFKAEAFAAMLYNNNLSAVFEVISEHDPHMVKYNGDYVVLLDLIENDFDFKYQGYTQVQHIAKMFNLYCKVRLANKSGEELFYSMDEINSLLDWIEEGAFGNIEGVVIRDSKGYMEKFKTSWYCYWKNIRRIGTQILAGKVANNIRGIEELDSDTLNALVAWCDHLIANNINQFNVIDFRNFCREKNLVN